MQENRLDCGAEQESLLEEMSWKVIAVGQERDTQMVVELERNGQICDTRGRQKSVRFGDRLDREG